jgi:hypothetical protein
MEKHLSILKRKIYLRNKHKISSKLTHVDPLNNVNRKSKLKPLENWVCATRKLLQPQIVKQATNSKIHASNEIIP